MEHYPLQTGDVTVGDTKDVMVSQAVKCSDHQEVSSPRDCIVTYGALLTTDFISRVTIIAVELSSLFVRFSLATT